MKNYRLKRRLLSNMNSLILVQVLERPNRIMPSGVIALCESQFPIYTNLAIAGASVSH